MKNNIQGKVIVITGASRGLGEAAGRQLAENGAKVILAARKEDELKKVCDNITQNGGEAAYFAMDVADKDSVRALMEFAVEKYGCIDVLINNAGTMPGSFLAKNNTDEWNALIDVNIKGVLYCIGAALPYMRERKTGHIINVCSTAAHEEAIPGATVYYATKAAVKVISDGLRKEETIAGSNIRVTNFSPGAIDTELKYTVTDPEMRELVIQAYDNHSALSADEMARALLYAIGQDSNIAVNEIIVRPAHK